MQMLISVTLILMLCGFATLACNSHIVKIDDPVGDPGWPTTRCSVRAEE